MQGRSCSLKDLETRGYSHQCNSTFQIDGRSKESTQCILVYKAWESKILCQSVPQQRLAIVKQDMETQMDESKSGYGARSHYLGEFRNQEKVYVCKAVFLSNVCSSAISTLFLDHTIMWDYCEGFVWY